eukprot:CAMPEP_0172155042 /NCGR_PEP_ID=MMETSP1050-20130122/2398_1 /TAXON_ID=233186 /ORGANISM="Cryptomonas curvata, Strain CCAP979/52" /LENGTH=205 /DNA_ID=CAMNT_0012823881 /DNA_START=174 /DNA_END=791 /DNA_ORIENTATION=-
MAQPSADSKSIPDELSRRSFLFGLSAIGLAASAKTLPAMADSLNGTLFEDTDRGFTLSIPPGWIQGTAEFPGASKSPTRPRIVSYLNPDEKDVNIAVVSYYVQPDQSKLGSLGTIEDVARTILGTEYNLDAEMFSQQQRDVGNGPAYIFDYRIDKRHLLTVFTLQAGSYGSNSLVTATLQAPISSWPKAEPVLRAAADSFRLKRI